MTLGRPTGRCAVHTVRDASRTGKFTRTGGTDHPTGRDEWPQNGRMTTEARRMVRGARPVVDGRPSGAWGAWLSGSGPTVAALCSPDDVDAVVAALPDTGHIKLLGIDPSTLYRKLARYEA